MYLSDIHVVNFRDCWISGTFIKMKIPDIMMGVGLGVGQVCRFIVILNCN